MAPRRVRPTHTDVEIADAVAKYTSPATERVAEVLTWGADENLLCALAAAWWVYCRAGSPAERVNSNHILLTTIAVTVIPKVLKTIFDQQRPDRLTIRGHLHGVPFSGKRLDAFPSGHAMHVGALASAATTLPRKKRNLVWAISAGLCATRIVLLAHWASDVAAGLAMGGLTERVLRFWTGYGSSEASRRAGARPRLRS
jgi:membrane-associated phospholipid phosphatase